MISNKQIKGNFKKIILSEVPMRFVSVLVLLSLLLTGCGSGFVWEQVQDEMPSQQVGCWQEEAYILRIGMPANMALTEEAEGVSFYETEDGACQAEMRTFLASDLNTAVRELSGFEADRLTVLKTTRFDLPMYRFAWYCQTAEGGRLCQAMLVMDGSVCYAAVCSTAEEAGDRYREEIRQVFAGFGLSDGERL